MVPNPPPLEVAPPQLCRQRRPNLPVRKNLGKLDHAPQCGSRIAAAVVGGQLLRQRRDNLLAIVGPLLCRAWIRCRNTNPPCNVFRILAMYSSSLQRMPAVASAAANRRHGLRPGPARTT